MTKAPPSKISRRELFDRIWSKPMTANAGELCSSAPGLTSLAKRLGLPLPRPGHWSKQAVGKEPLTPEYPADPKFDGETYIIPPAIAHRLAGSTSPAKIKQGAAAIEMSAVEAASFEVQRSSHAANREEASSNAIAGEHKKVGSTRGAIRKSRSTDRTMFGGRGKFRLLVTPAAGERACTILNQLVAAVETRGWSIDNSDQGFAIVTDGETIGFLIEEQLDRRSHVITPAETKEKAEYDRKCALADRGIGYRPWRPPAIPEYDHVPNGELTLKLDHNYDAGGTRRTFSDGKRQRLENLVPAMLDSLEQWASAVKAKREERDQWKRDWEEQDRRRKDRERQARVEGYRITFLQRQVDRQREIDGLASLIRTWEGSNAPDPQFAELLEFAKLYRTWLEAKLAPAAIAERIAALKLMDDNVYIYDAKSLD